MWKRESKIQYLKGKASGIFLLCTLSFLFLLFTGLNHVWADPPIARDDPNYTVNEDMTLSVPTPGVLDNDSDIDGDALKAIKISGPTNGMLDLDPNTGSFIYVPNLNFFGTDSFHYKANDGYTDSNKAATVTITVKAVNDAPEAVDDLNYPVDEDGTLNVPVPGVLGNDSDIDGDALKAIKISGPMNGTLYLDPNTGSFAYVPDADFCGTDSFIYKANDGTADSTMTATVNITVRAVNDPPVAGDDPNYSVSEDETLIIGPDQGVLSNDVDIDNITLKTIRVTDPTNGALESFDPNTGAFTYTPNANFFGLDHFMYKAHDGISDSTIATVTITVKAVNDPPEAEADTYIIDEDLPLIVPASQGVLVNDMDVESNELTAEGPYDHIIKLEPNGSFLFDPNANFCGTYTFTYKAHDGHDYSNLATVNIIVNPINDPPEAPKSPLLVTTPENQNTVITLTGTDPDGDSLEFRIVELPNKGVLYQYADGNMSEENRMVPSPGDPNTVNIVVQDPQHRVIYIPPLYYSGGKWDDEFSYMLNDGNVDSLQQGKVEITIAAMNNPPNILSDPNAIAKVEMKYSYHIIVEDLDTMSGPPKITADMPMPNWLTLTDHADGTATLEGRPTFSDICPPLNNCNKITIRATDSLNIDLFDFQTFHIELTTPYFDEITLNETNDLITSNTVWGEGDCKKVIIKVEKGSNISSYTVDPNVILTIKAGTIVEFHDDLELKVSGTLRAEGEQGSMITFTGTNWGGITFSSEDPNTASQDPNNGSRLSYCKIEKANDMFGALTLKNISNIIIQNCVITENEAMLGGGIYLQDSDQKLENIIVSNNKALIRGGGIYCDNSGPTLINTIITNNSAIVEGGGGLYCDNSSPTLIHTTISKNLSPAGAGIFCASSSPIIKNTILYYNNESDSDGNDTGKSREVYLADDNSDPIFYYCDIQGGRDFQMPTEVTYLGAYEDNLDSDPQFLLPSPMAGVISGFLADWRLNSTSPCINAGDPASRGEDFNGLERPYNFSNRPLDLYHEIFADIGAHEYQNNPPFEGKNEEDPNGYIIDENTQVIIAISDYLSDYYDADPNDIILYIKIDTLPQYGSLYQYDSNKKYRRGDILLTPGSILTDPNYRVIYVPANRNSEYSVDFSWRVNDGNMDSPKKEIVTIEVITNNERPIFITLPDEIIQAPFDFVYEIETFDFDEDDTGDTLTVEARILPDWLILTDHGDGTATLRGETSENRVGTHEVTLRVTDTHNRYSEQQFTIEVTERNRLSVDAGFDITGAPNLDINLKAIGSENDTAFYTWKIFLDPNDPPVDEISGNPCIWIPPDKGIYTVEVTINDKEGSVPATDTTTLIVTPGFVFVDFDNREYPDPNQENKIYTISSVNDIALVSQWNLNLTQRGKVLEAIMETDLTNISQTQTSQIIGSLFNLVIIDQASENEKVSEEQTNQINQILTILDSIVTQSDSLNTMQLHKSVDVLNEMIQYYGNSNLTPGQSAKISTIVKKIVLKSAEEVISNRYTNDLYIHNGNFIRISVRQVNLGKEPQSVQIGGPEENEAKIILSLETMAELKARFTVDKVTANLAVNAATGKSLGIMLSASLTGDTGAGFHVADLANLVEIHIPITDPSRNMPMYFDESTDIWSTHCISEVSDISGKIIVFKVNHLTDFALFPPQPAESEDNSIGKIMSKLDEGCFIEAVDIRQ